MAHLELNSGGRWSTIFFLFTAYRCPRSVNRVYSLRMNLSSNRPICTYYTADNEPPALPTTSDTPEPTPPRQLFTHHRMSAGPFDAEATPPR